MAEPKRSDDERAENDPKEPVVSRGGGFGEFAEVYRTRWAASHPNMIRRWAAHDVPMPSPQAAAPAAEADPTDVGSAPPPAAPASG